MTAEELIRACWSANRAQHILNLQKTLEMRVNCLDAAELRIKELEGDCAMQSDAIDALRQLRKEDAAQLQAHQQALKEAKVALAGMPAERMKCIERINSVLNKV